LGENNKSNWIELRNLFQIQSKIALLGFSNKLPGKTRQHPNIVLD
jgi:hypothetical protein